uniref:Uncharacterized protein n=2 Tax=Aegilops tauschii subsp. strangulata TaxID=200361 RepID=A0A453NSL6_AEGTS
GSSERKEKIPIPSAVSYAPLPAYSSSLQHRVYPRRRRIAWTEETPCRRAPFCRDWDGDGGPGGGKFRWMVAVVASEGARGGVLLASLAELCEALSFCTEDAGGYFPVESAASCGWPAPRSPAPTRCCSPCAPSPAGGWILVMKVVPGFLLYRGLHELGQYAFSGNSMGASRKEGIPTVSCGILSQVLNITR